MQEDSSGRVRSFGQYQPWHDSTTSTVNSSRSTNTTVGQPALEPTTLDSQQLLKATLDSSVNFIQVFQALRDGDGKIIDFTWVLTNRRWQETYGDVIGNQLLIHSPAVVQTGIFERMV